jgi:hypothetical protein
MNGSATKAPPHSLRERRLRWLVCVLALFFMLEILALALR